MTDSLSTHVHAQRFRESLRLVLSADEAQTAAKFLATLDYTQRELFVKATKVLVDANRNILDAVFKKGDSTCDRYHTTEGALAVAVDYLRSVGYDTEVVHVEVSYGSADATVRIKWGNMQEAILKKFSGE